MSGESSGDGANRPWTVEQIVAGDGTRCPSGFVMHKGHYYASSSRDCGDEGFHEIDVDSIHLSSRGGRNVRYHVKAVMHMARVKARPKEGPTVHISKEASSQQKRRQLQKVVKRFMDAHPGFAVVVGGPGARAVSTRLTKYYSKESGPIFMRASEGECAVAAVVNAVDILMGRDVEIEAKKYLMEKCPHYLRVASCAEDIHKVCKNHDLRKVPKTERKEYDEDRFAWIGKLNRGIWLVRLVQPHVVDHCVVVGGPRKLTIDSEEEYPVRLSVETLRLCGGDEADKLVVAEAREVRGAVDHKGQGVAKSK